MKLYLVRHGQSVGNLNKLHQFSHTPLSDLGRKQAEVVAKRFSSIPVDLIMASDFTRAHKTAEIIAKHLNKPLETNQQLREIKRPSEIEGKLTTDPVVVSIKSAIKDNLHDPSWHYSDEENVFDLIARAKKFLHEIQEKTASSILAVSHGNLIGAIAGNIILGDLLTAHIYKTLESSMWYSNTGITVLEWSGNKWHLITWNDNAHLGNL